MKKACVYFHQGWTDIINCLPLVNYYNELYDEITILIRSDAKLLFDFYIRNFTNVKVVYLNTDNGRYYGNFEKTDLTEVEYLPQGNAGLVRIPKDFSIMFHAEHDIYREDSYKGYWYRSVKKPSNHFVESFYTYYDIPYTSRVSKFDLNRDVKLEESCYSKFINENTKNYILYHDDENNHKNGTHHVSTKLNLPKKWKNHSYINLNKVSPLFFDYIKIIENAKELHLIDSVWASLCYLLDSRYGLLSSVDVRVYCKRGHHQMFIDPVKLSNWQVIL